MIWQKLSVGYGKKIRHSVQKSVSDEDKAKHKEREYEDAFGCLTCEQKECKGGSSCPYRKEKRKRNENRSY